MKNSTKALLALLCCAVLIMGLGLTMLLSGARQGEPLQNSSSYSAPSGSLNASLMEGVRVSQKTMEGVPLLEYTTGIAAPQPVVILIHGLTGDKSVFEPLALQLAKQNFLVLCPDAYGHGDRKNDPPLSALEMACETARDIDKYLAHYDESTGADKTRLILAGFSLGGFSAYHYAANGNMLPTAVVTVCATPDWEEMVGRSITYTTYENQRSHTIRDENARTVIDAFLTENNPMPVLETETSIRFQMMFGAKDETVPYMGGLRLSEALAATAPGMASFKLDEEMGHAINEEQVIEIYEYICNLF